MLRFSYDPTVGSNLFARSGVGAGSLALAAVAALTLGPTAVRFSHAATGTWSLAYERGSKSHAPICLSRAPTAVGSGARQWQAQLATPTSQCQEYLAADIDRRVLYLGMADVRSLGGYQGGQADAYCPPSEARGSYSACNSTFFVRSHPESPAYRRLDKQALRTAIETSGVIPMLEELAQARETAAAEAKLAAYRGEFAAATTLPAIRGFIGKYGDNDPEGYVPQLRERLATLQRSRFAAIQTSTEAQTFIRDFQADDPAQLLQAAQQRLARVQDAERAKGEVDGLVGRIAFCKASMRAAEQAIAREREIERVSGTVSLARLHQAGERLVQCREAIPRLYTSYRAKGGKRSLDSIN